MFLTTQFQNFRSNERAFRQIKGSLGLLGRNPFCFDFASLFGVSGQIKDRDTQNQRVSDNLYRLAILARGERGALRFMASYDFIQGADQRVNIEISV